MLFPRPLVLVLALHGALAASAADDFAKAMASNDATTKKAALQSLASSPEKDEVVLPLLVGAVGDRQAHEAAIQALRSRTHLTPAAYRGQSHYPNYPSGDTAADWSTWLAERTREKDQEAKVKEAEKVAAEAKKKAEAASKEKDKGKEKGDAKGEAKTGEGETTAEGEKGEKAAPGDADKTDKAATTDKTGEGEAVGKPVRENSPPPQDLGKLDRVVFKNGSNLVCYILTRRTDADGNLISLRVVHPDGSGEETLSADMIARIEEDAVAK